MSSYFQEAVSFVVSSLPGSLSLRYNLTVLSQDESVYQRFFTEGRVDGQAFLQMTVR